MDTARARAMNASVINGLLIGWNLTLGQVQARNAKENKAPQCRGNQPPRAIVAGRLFSTSGGRGARATLAPAGGGGRLPVNFFQRLAGGGRELQGLSWRLWDTLGRTTRPV